MPIFPALELLFFLFCAALIFFRPHGRKRKIGAFLAENGVHTKFFTSKVRKSISKKAP